CLQRFAIQLWIAVGVKQAGFGGEQGACAITFDGTAFEYDITALDRTSVSTGRSQALGQAVIALCFELAAPAGKYIVEQSYCTVAFNGNGAVVAGPGVVRFGRI